jgi:L-amino acid N-acyltransferase YncA
MDIGQRTATTEDLARIVELYGPAEGEQVVLRELWGLADGIADPLKDTLQSVLDNPESHVIVGLIDGVVFGFAYGSIEDLLPQAGGERIGVIRIIYVEEGARMVGVGEEMLDGMMGWFRSQGLSRFDAIVSPGHRLAKNFFEAAGFKARRITMYRHDQ